MTESREERQERILGELREATREAAGVLKDLTRALAEAKGLGDKYASEVFAPELAKIGDRTREIVEELQAAFIEDFKAVRDEACTMAKKHMDEDWRLACAVNAVGHQVLDVLTMLDKEPDELEHRHPELKDDLNGRHWALPPERFLG